MDSKLLKESLTRMGVPVYENGKIKKKDIEGLLPLTSSGLEVESIKKLGVDKHEDHCTCRMHLTVAGGRSHHIDDAVGRNQDHVEKALAEYLNKIGLASVTHVELVARNRNDNNLWLDVNIYYDHGKLIDKNDLACFFYRLIER